MGVVLKSEWDIVRISIVMTGTFHLASNPGLTRPDFISQLQGCEIKSGRVRPGFEATFHPRNHFPHFFDRNAEELSKFGLLWSHCVVGQSLYSANIINTLIAVKVYLDVLPVPY